MNPVAFRGARRLLLALSPHSLRRILPAAAVLCLIVPALGQEQRNRLEPVVITATRHPTSLGHTASSVAVIDREDLLLRQCVLLSDALSMTPGLSIADGGMPGSLATVMTRGTATKDTSLWVDGRPQIMNLAGSFNVEMFALDQLERIEVLRGPGSSLYGGRAMGGVLQLITRRPAANEATNGSLLAEAGSHGMHRSALQMQGAQGAMDWSMSLSRFDSDGQRINHAVGNSSGSLNLGWQLDPQWRLELQGSGVDQDLGVPGTIRVNDRDETLRSEIWNFSPRLIWEPDSQTRHSLTYQHSRQMQDSTGVSRWFQNNNNLRMRSDWLEYQSYGRFHERLQWLVGASMQDQSFERFNADSKRRDIDMSQTQSALFAQLQFQPITTLDLIAGLRRDEFSDFEDATTYKLAAALRPFEGTRVHAQFGTAYTPPTPQDLTPVFYSDPNLMTPERSRGYELGVHQAMWRGRVESGVTGFRNDLRNTYRYRAPDYLPEPIGEATTQGVESSLRVQCREGLALSLGHTFLDAWDDSNAVRLVRRPRHQTSAQLLWRPVSALTFGLGGVWCVAREDYLLNGDQGDIEDFLNLRFTASWQLNSRLELHARVENMLGERYEATAGYPVPSTGFYGGLRLRF